jgi:hypothetical protein
MTSIVNGMPATELGEVTWQKSPTSTPSGNCVELAALVTGEVAVRNSRHPDGPALIFTRDEILHFVRGAGEGAFDHLVD